MRAKTITLDPDAVDPNGIFETAAVAGAGAIALDGALVTDDVATMDYARVIGIVSAGNDAGITFTIVGMDADGRTITEVVTGANAGTAESTLYFLTVSSITASGAAAGNVTIGTVDEFVSQTIPLNHHAKDPHTVSIEVVTGTIDFTIHETFSSIWDENNALVWQQSPFNANLTAVAHDNMDEHITGLRFVANSYSTGAAVKFVIHQNG